jgi:hypothetical protein
MSGVCGTAGGSDSSGQPAPASATGVVEPVSAPLPEDAPEDEEDEVDDDVDDAPLEPELDEPLDEAVEPESVACSQQTCPPEHE